MRNELFRKEAIENIQSQYDSHENLFAIPIKLRLMIIVLLICFVAFAIWLFRGNITQAAYTEGIVYSKNGMQSIYSEVGGIITDVLVKSGDTVNAGDVIAVVSDNSMLKAAETSELITEYVSSHVIRSYKDGVLMYVANEFANVSVGDLIADIIELSTDMNDRLVYTFISSDMANNISVGMNAQVSLTFAPREKYGYIEGYVSEISQYTKKGDAISQSFNYMLSNVLDANSVYHMVAVTLLPDSTTQNGLRCSNPRSGVLPVKTGAFCNVDIIYGNSRPYEWLFSGSYAANGG